MNHRDSGSSATIDADIKYREFGDAGLVHGRRPGPPPPASLSLSLALSLFLSRCHPEQALYLPTFSHLCYCQ